MNLEAAASMAEAGKLYPGVILHGGAEPERRQAAVGLARRLLCERPGEDPDAACRHCRRLGWVEEEGFHPDFQVLERDLKTATSVDATKRFLKGAQVAPFEARGQVFVIAAADSLSGEAANALLKTLEEPHLTSPRHFLLLAPSQFDLLPTLRSRSLEIFLGASQRPSADEVEAVAVDFGAALVDFASSRASVDLLVGAAALLAVDSWKDVRAARPWTLAAAAVRQAIDDPSVTVPRRALLDLAEALLDGPRLRLRGITAKRIIEGLVIEHLAVD